MGSFERPKAARDFLLHFGHAEVVFTLIVGEWHERVAQESQGFDFEFAKTLQEIARFITQELGGDFLFGLKGNQSGVLDKAERLLAQQAFFSLWTKPSGKRNTTGLIADASPGSPSPQRRLDSAAAGR